MTAAWRRRSGVPLSKAAPGNALYRNWLEDDAARQLAAVNDGNPAPAPWFKAPEAEAWADEHRRDLPAADRPGFDRDLASLQRGEAAVVVTGQQPGFLGGPLLTVYKIATAVALARRLNAVGRPTIPVFWSGDDDDDLVEALQALAWRPGRGIFRSCEWAAARHGDRNRRRLGTLDTASWHDEAGDWFADAGGTGDDLELSRCWRDAVAAGVDWRALTRRCLLAAFRGCGLMVISGDDPRLHGAGAEFYDEVKDRRRELAGLAREEGFRLAAAGGHAQVGERSLAHSLYRVDGETRRPLEGGALVPAETIRPGVLLRSPLQDQLLSPRAVVVGPGELAYLRQLAPVYRALSIRRSPLVPRLACWLLPAGMDRKLLSRHQRAADAEAGGDAALAGWLEETRFSLEKLLRRDLDVPAERAYTLTQRRTERWVRGLRSLVRGERAHIRSGGPREPGWVFPHGQRQERALAWLPALALGGRMLRQAILAAADDHLEAGAGGDWREWECDIHDSNVF